MKSKIYFQNFGIVPWQFAVIVRDDFIAHFWCYRALPCRPGQRVHFGRKGIPQHGTDCRRQIPVCVGISRPVASDEKAHAMIPLASSGTKPKFTTFHVVTP
ncbi:MAG TPA: hypothetical protein VF437_07715 [Verrucomicrobiae bacterium]